MEGIASNILEIRKKLGGKVRLVAITKGRGIGEIEEAIAAGITEIGESRVQEAAEKLPLLPMGITRHMVGHLQRNKVREAVGLFDVVQSVDSVALAKKISAEAAAQKKRIAAYLQVNVSGKGTQGGFSSDEIDAAAREIRMMQNGFFAVEGLMCIAGMENPRDDFHRAAQIAKRLGLPTISMGMSDDYPLALSEGSNMVRIGRALFQKE